MTMYGGSGLARMPASGSRELHREAFKNLPDGSHGFARGAERQAVQAAQHELTGCASAQHSGDFCDARLTRAPQETGESLGSFLATFWRSKVTGPRGHEAR